ncbi:class I SAM-dependent methyltransferase [Actinospica durhamensis]|uniref:Class I SAM-dependent methyltransferase n=1 Tax=Actinospica durhamensis TaxID=1508375 RepID=A0A941EP15_9ACTN|nr:class I SAM-dependent methyltransferase [Actinospica durhamensis]MBR7834561.1 class I SAM-dependent methyltransferase [Actinospica durhamensis]
MSEQVRVRQDDEIGARQQRHWQATYEQHPGVYGALPSAAAVAALAAFEQAGARRVLELGAGHGRDALGFARAGLSVDAIDYSREALAQLVRAAQAEGLADAVAAVEHDARDKLPYPDGEFDAVYAHMLLCMALTTDEIRAVVDEVRRVLRPGGLFVYTVRHTGDEHYGAGVALGEDVYEHGGFAVHFFSRELVDDLARGWQHPEVEAFEEGELPRRLWRVTQVRAA